ncbi:major capsid protein [Nocardia nova]|uniref:major capsid protein n=1 Tax=Nocardia nova TaxID=37330 RepID=UPI001894F8AC|nr:major capsid protein [Nocardia nova]MBF6277061.1 major capsid protein [Nocardia nova]
MKFQMPESLDGLSIEQLTELATAAETEFAALEKEVVADGAVPSAEVLADMKALDAAGDALVGRIGELRAEDQARADEARQLIEARNAKRAEAEGPEDDDTETDAEEAETDDTDETGAEVVAEAEAVTQEAAQEAVTAATKPKVANFKGLGARTGKSPARVAPKPEIGFRMQPNTPKFADGVVGYSELAASIDSMAVSRAIRANRAPHRDRGSMVAMSLGTLARDFAQDRLITADDELGMSEQVSEIIRATPYKPNEFALDGALTASAGWCSPSDTSYEFCEVNPATDLVTLPDMNITRGGIRRPVDPDFSELYATLPFRYTEAELQGNPTKPCIEIPCTEFEEIRAEAIGLCVTAGILQRRGYPELIARFMAETMKAHAIKLSLWTIQDMVTGSNAITIPAAAGIGGAGAILNGLALRATLIRQKERIAHNAPIEGVAPTWLLKAAAADMALQQGVDVKAVTDATVDGWLSDRNIRIQWVGHWQGIPDNAAYWPGSAQVLLYPSGAWFRHLANVIEVGTLYDKAQLQANRYTELFTEDEYLVDNRCRVSEVVTVPVTVNGAVGDRITISAPTFTNEKQTATISGSPTGGTFALGFKGKTTAALAYNASLAAVQSALAGLSTIGTGNVAVTGTPGTSYVVTFQGALAATDVPAITATGSFTGGTSPSIAVAETTKGSPNVLA